MSRVSMPAFGSLQTVIGSKEHRARLQALRTVALLEFGKGLLVLVAAFSLYWADPNDVAGGFLSFLHISPDRPFAQLLLRWAESLTIAKVWFVVLISVVYSGWRCA